MLQERRSFGEGGSGVIAAGPGLQEWQTVIQQLQQVLRPGVVRDGCRDVLAGRDGGDHESCGECAESLTSQHGMLLP